MKQYLRDRQNEDKRGSAIGLVLTIAAHLLLCLVFVFSGIKYLYPPPTEQTFLIDFEEEEEKPVQVERKGREPMAEEVDKSKEINLVQKSESPHTATKTNKTPATKPDNFGDVETPTPKQEPELDPRASFPGMSKKDTSVTTPHSAEKAGSTFKAGQTEGNTSVGKTDGTPNAHLKGRNTLGVLPRPSYTVQNSGKVVVDIWVDRYGNVQKAVPGGAGTTVTDKALWQAARNAAMKTHFNQDADAPALQQGTITYIFNLK